MHEGASVCVCVCAAGRPLNRREIESGTASIVDVNSEKKEIRVGDEKKGGAPSEPFVFDQVRIAGCGWGSGEREQRWSGWWRKREGSLVVVGAVRPLLGVGSVVRVVYAMSGRELGRSWSRVHACVT